MSINQLINPINPIDIQVNDAIVNGDLSVLGDLNIGSITLSRAGGDVIPNINVDNLTIGDPAPDIIIDKKIVNYDESHPKANCRTYTSNLIQIRTPATIDPANPGNFRLRLNDPVLTPDWKKINLLASGGGTVNVLGTDRAGNFWLNIDPFQSSEGFIILEFVSVFGDLKPDTLYTFSFKFSVLELP